jgi:hypothetical protein
MSAVRFRGKAGLLQLARALRDVRAGRQAVRAW